MPDETTNLRDFAADFKSAAFRTELRTSWSTAILYRWAGVPVAWLAARTGIRPIAITFLALFVALSLPVVASVSGESSAPYFVLALAILFQVLDCADGTLARATRQTSTLGGDLDFLCDMIQWGMLYFAIGILADRQFETGWSYSAVAAMAAWARLMARVTRDRVAVEAEPKDTLKPFGLLASVSLVLGGVSGLIPFLALSGDWLGVAVWALLIYGVLDIIEGGLPLIWRA